MKTKTILFIFCIIYINSMIYSETQFEFVFEFTYEEEEKLQFYKEQEKLNSSSYVFYQKSDHKWEKKDGVFIILREDHKNGPRIYAEAKLSPGSYKIYRQPKLNWPYGTSTQFEIFEDMDGVVQVPMKKYEVIQGSIKIVDEAKQPFKGVRIQGPHNLTGQFVQDSGRKNEKYERTVITNKDGVAEIAFVQYQKAYPFLSSSFDLQSYNVSKNIVGTDLSNKYVWKAKRRNIHAMYELFYLDDHNIEKITEENLNKIFGVKYDGGMFLFPVYRYNEDLSHWNYEGFNRMVMNVSKFSGKNNRALLGGFENGMNLTVGSYIQFPGQKLYIIDADGPSFQANDNKIHQGKIYLSREPLDKESKK